MQPERIPFPNTNPQPVIITGSVAYDDILTPHGSGTRILGGSAAYAALAASFFSDTKIVGIVGNDFAEKDRERLHSRKIDTAGLTKDESGPTFFWRGRYHENYNRRDTLALELGVFEKFEPKLPDALRDIPFVMLGNIAPVVQLRFLEQMRKPRFVLLDSMNFWIDNAKEDLLNIVKRADMFVANDTEAEELAGEKNIIVAGRKLLELGPKCVLVKKGEHGALLFHPDGLFALPAFPVTELRDPTGAGDSFAGALIGTLAALGRTDFDAMKTAMLYATVVASLTVEAFSCDRLEAAGVAEIQSRVNELRKITRLPE